MSKNEQKRANISKKRAKKANTFKCKICDYNTSRHSNYLRHVETKKHLEKHMKVLKSVKSVKNDSTSYSTSCVPVTSTPLKQLKKDKFYCELCNYKASQKSHYNKHLKTKKHISRKAFFSCQPVHTSGPHFSDKGLSEDYKKEINEGINTSPGVLKGASKKTQKQEIDSLKKQIYSIIENQKEIKKETDNIKNNKQGQVIYNNNISINFFLDTYCSKAQPIQDFISNMSFKLGDIMRNNQLVEGFISKKLLKGLEDMPVTERPIHCTDQKRRNFIVKDERAGWIKDIATDNNSKLYTRVDQLHKKAYIDFYNEYDKENPLPHDGEKEQIKFNISSQIIRQNDDINKVIIRDIAKQVDIYDALDGIDSSMIENENGGEIPIIESVPKKIQTTTQVEPIVHIPDELYKPTVENTNINLNINITDKQ
jgi:hypothetical protein